MPRYVLDKANMAILDTKNNVWVCLVGTKRPDLFEQKVNEMLKQANAVPKLHEACMAASEYLKKQSKRSYSPDYLLAILGKALAEADGEAES